MSEHADLTPVAAELQAYRELDAQIKALKEIQSTLRGRIEDALGDHELGLVDGEPAAMYKFIKSRRFDQKAFAKAHPQLAAEFVTVTESRRFKVVDS